VTALFSREDYHGIQWRRNGLACASLAAAFSTLADGKPRSADEILAFAVAPRLAGARVSGNRYATARGGVI